MASDQQVGAMTSNPGKLPLRCRCGNVQGIANQVAPDNGFRFICYCRDCQAFAHFLKRPDVLDEAGGTDIFQMPAGHLKITAGMGAVRCLRLSSKVFRWYADCCKTPIGNTAGPHFPVIGLIHSFMDCDLDGHLRDELLGPSLCRIFEHSATGPLPANAPAPPSIGLFALRGSKLVGWWLRGLSRPNPFFDGPTNAQLSAPAVLTAVERASLAEDARDRHPAP
jgi:hypothetical protein